MLLETILLFFILNFYLTNFIIKGVQKKSKRLKITSIF